MNTYQAIGYGIVHGLSEFWPASSGAHHFLVSYILDWPVPNGAFAGALALGALLALLVYFRHEWSCMISCFLKVVLFRKKPMTLDERLPFFLALTTLPPALAWIYLRERIGQLEWSPLWIAAVLALAGIPLILTDSRSRKTKGNFDWNWFDALLVGFCQIAELIPGVGRMTGLLIGAFMRNYTRESAVRYSLFASAPLLAGSAYQFLRDVNFHSPQPMEDTTWLSFYVAILITFLVSLLAIGGLMKHIQRNGFGKLAAYRILVACAVGVVFWIRSRSGA
jgi:undecaprenyl-diphosphatase